MSSVSVSVGHVTRYHTDIPLIRRVIEVKTYRWNVLDVSEPICVLRAAPIKKSMCWVKLSGSPLPPRHLRYRCQSLHHPRTPGTLPNLEEMINMIERRRQEISEEQRPQPESVTPPPPPLVSPFPPYNQQRTGVLFLGEWGMLPGGPCLFGGVALEFAFVYSPHNLLGGSGYLYPEQCQPLDHLALP